MIDFKKELDKLSNPDLERQFLNCENDVNVGFSALNGTVTKIFKKQGAMNMQLEEIYSILEENEKTDIIKSLEHEKSYLVNTLIGAADLVEDFYVYYKEHYDENLSTQSKLMWNTLCKAMTGAGLIRIADENTPFNMQLNSIENTTCDNAFPNGNIVKVLKSGYIYNNTVYRKSIVIVNRLEEESE